MVVPVPTPNTVLAVYGSPFFLFGLWLLLYAQPSEGRLYEHSFETVARLHHYAWAAIALAACAVGDAAIMHYRPSLLTGVSVVPVLLIFMIGFGLIGWHAYEGARLDPAFAPLFRG